MRSRRLRLSILVTVAPILGLHAHLSTIQPAGHLSAPHVVRHAQHSARPRPPLSDATSTNTKDWACIRFHESTNGLLSSNLYQFQFGSFQAITGLDRSPGSYPRAVQDRAALALYAYWQRADGIGFHPWLADRYDCDLPW